MTGGVEVEVERLPVWVHVASAGVIVVGVLAALQVVPMLALLPFLVASSVGRRFDARAVRVVVKDGSVEAGAEVWSAGELRDVWLDDDEVTPRVVVGLASEVRVLRLREQSDARQLSMGIAPLVDGETRTVVAGVRPALVDVLGCLRFVAVAAAFVATGSRIGGLVLVFFGMGAWSLVRARQLVVERDGFELRGLFTTERYAHGTVRSVAIDEGIVRLLDGREETVTRGTLRDASGASAEWLVRARGRALAALAERADAARSGSAG